MNTPARILLFATVVLLGAQVASAQYGAARRPQAAKAKRERFDGKGTIQAVGPSGLQVLVGKDTWAVAVKPVQYKFNREKQQRERMGGTDVTVRGTAEAGVLRSGMFVRFSARFDKRGRTTDTLKDVHVFSPDENTQLGVTRDNVVGAEDEASKDSKAAFLVIGRVAGVRNGKMTVLAGRAKIQVAVADEAILRLEVADHRFAKKGDKVHVKGFYFGAVPARGPKPVVNADRLEIEMVGPLKAPRSKKPKRQPLRQKEKPAAKLEFK